MTSQNPWKTVLISATSKDLVASGESTTSSNLNSSILFNSLERSINSLQLNIHCLNGKILHRIVANCLFNLGRQGELGYLTEVTKPTDGDSTLKTWKSKNSLIIGWLINSMELAINKSFMYLSTTKDVWEAIRIRIPIWRILCRF